MFQSHRRFALENGPAGLAHVMKTPLALLVVAFAATGCATVQKSRFDALDDREIAKLAVREALGELHHVETVDAESMEVKRGTPAFASREEKLAYDARLEQALRSKLTGQAPVLDQLSAQCRFEQKKGFKAWPKEELKTQALCAWADASVSLHSLWKKPRLHLIYLNTLLDVVNDPEFTIQTLNKYDAQSEKPREGYVFKLGAWDAVEGFRTRG